MKHLDNTKGVGDTGVGDSDSLSESTKVGGNQVDKLSELLREYFALKDQSKRTRKARMLFMANYNCLTMKSDDYNEPPINCIERFRADIYAKGDEMCDECKERHGYYLRLSKNAHRRGVIMRQLRHLTRGNDLKPSDSDIKLRDDKSPKETTLKKIGSE
jgi:hypothetical protein